MNLQNKINERFDETIGKVLMDMSERKLMFFYLATWMKWGVCWSVQSLRHDISSRNWMDLKAACTELDEMMRCGCSWMTGIVFQCLLMFCGWKRQIRFGNIRSIGPLEIERITYHLKVTHKIMVISMWRYLSILSYDLPMYSGTIP